MRIPITLPITGSQLYSPEVYITCCPMDMAVVEGFRKSITPAKQRKVCGVFLSFWGCSVQEDVGSGYKFWPHAHKRHEELHEVMAAKAGD